MSARLVRIDAIQQEAIDIRSFELADAHGMGLPRFTPGSHIDVRIGPGLVRQYSLCNGPEGNGRYLIAVKREPNSRACSRAMHEQMKVGDLLTISAPRNRFALSAVASHHLLLAAGIGVTPILSMARHLAARRASFQLQYFTRSVEHTSFRALLAGPQFEGKVSLNDGMSPDDLKGYLQDLLQVVPGGAHLYLCGPRPFMDLVGTIAAQTWPLEAVHVEYFSAGPASHDGPETSFRIRLARSGVTLTVPEGQSIVEVLVWHGVEIETSCSQGICGTCLTGVLEGVPDHRDVFFTADQTLRCDRILL
jgi:vanillate O-demethylase ferredoxin subunit